MFGELATTVDECRAELVGAYLMDDAELLAMFGFTADSEITAQDRKTERCLNFLEEQGSLIESKLLIMYTCSLEWTVSGVYKTSMWMTT